MYRQVLQTKLYYLMYETFPASFLETTHNPDWKTTNNQSIILSTILQCIKLNGILLLLKVEALCNYLCRDIS